MNVILIGYRGTGKSTVGRLLAAALPLGFRDADEELERRAGRTIRQIFAEGGEVEFRGLESNVIAELLQQNGLIVALGGGAVLRPENRALIRSRGNKVFWLQASPQTLYDRIQADSSTSARRPNLTAAGGLDEVVRLLGDRAPLYRECADFSIDTQGQTPEQIAAQIVSLLVG
jgi:shikimate kinase